MQTSISSTLKKEELLAQSELLALAIEVAFREKLYKLLTDPNTDPELLLKYLKMNEKREEMKLKEQAAHSKQREVALKEATGERRLALDERKQALNEKKFQHETAEADETPTEEKALAPVPNKTTKPTEAAKPSEMVGPVDSHVPVARNVNSVDQGLKKSA